MHNMTNESLLLNQILCMGIYTAYWDIHLRQICKLVLKVLLFVEKLPTPTNIVLIMKSC